MPKTSPNLLYRSFPILSWLPHYNAAWFSGDLMAGFTTWGVVIPAMIAYAGLAGVPAQAGLYTALASLTIYAILGTSKQLVLASTSASAIMIGSTIAGFTPSNTTASYELVTVLVPAAPNAPVDQGHHLSGLCPQRQSACYRRA